MFACQDEIGPTDFHKLRFPIDVSDKLDGIRCLTMINEKEDECAGFSRTLKLLPNLHLQRRLSYTCVGFDGEIVIDGLDFNDIQSRVMTKHTLPFKFTYYLFDHWDTEPTPYHRRLRKLHARFARYGIEECQLLPIRRIHNVKELEHAYHSALERGREGLIVRDPIGPYKHGRSTFNEGWMLKVKPLKDAEAIVIGFEEEMENLNPQTEDNFGRAKRSKHKANLRGKGTLGALICKDCKTGVVFNIGTGFTHAMKDHIWNLRAHHEGRIVTYTYLDHGIKDKPRHPRFKGFRKD